ncbi:hypothetical protein GV792_04535 [Nocardia cyriacigeorgica]|uniref:hypothetical protein n=1 Tax=Nocardia cyriacigeorgica TaxID=135487 RepID=UPI0013B61242|nr:hypothetical protein [Nocardia cyriacigeorgica]NEW49310.1 hypothetical protein [Nocardia cyriacigeorgica]
MIATAENLPENIAAAECIEIAMALFTETPAGGTRWVIGTVAQHGEEGIILDTLEPTEKGRFGYIEDDAAWFDRAAKVLADRGWKAKHEGDLALDSDIELVRA